MNENIFQEAYVLDAGLMNCCKKKLELWLALCSLIC